SSPSPTRAWRAKRPRVKWIHERIIAGPSVNAAATLASPARRRNRAACPSMPRKHWSVRCRGFTLSPASCCWPSLRRCYPGRQLMATITREDVEYLRHGERKIMARIFKPEGAGPFPCFIDLHGGAWNNGDLNDRTGLGEYLAERGVVMPT